MSSLLSSRENAQQRRGVKRKAPPSTQQDAIYPREIPRTQANDKLIITSRKPIKARATESESDEDEEED